MLSALIRCELLFPFGSLVCSLPAPRLVDTLVGTMTALFLLVVVVVVVDVGPVVVTTVVVVGPVVLVIVNVGSNVVTVDNVVGAVVVTTVDVVCAVFISTMSTSSMNESSFEAIGGGTVEVLVVDDDDLASDFDISTATSARSARLSLLFTVGGATVGTGTAAIADWST